MSGIIRKKEPGQAWESLPDTESGGSQPIVMASKNITSAELLALNNTSVELLPALGGRLLYFVQGVMLHYRFVTTPYNEAFSFPLCVGYGTAVADICNDSVGGILAPINTANQNFFQSTADRYINNLFEISGKAYGYDASVCEDAPVSIALRSDFALTGGDSTLTVTTLYAVIDGAPT